MELSILIPTVPERASNLLSLLDSLKKQLGVFKIETKEYYDGKLMTISSEKVEVLVFESPINSTSLGVKRNRLIDASIGNYVCFIDDDDRVCKYYVKWILNLMHFDRDVIGFRGEYLENGVFRKEFRISLEYDKWSETPTHYERTPNHLSPVKREIAQQARFPDKTVGEDYEYSLRLKALLKSQMFLNNVLYYYDYNSNKTIAQKK